QRRWRGDRHFRRRLGVRSDEFEMLDHGMRALGAELADHAQHHRLGLRALELDLALAEIGLDAGKLAEEVVVPKRAAELTVGARSRPDVLLLADRRLDLAVLDRRELGGGDLAALALLARRLQRRRAQEATHVIGAERRLGAGHARPYRCRSATPSQRAITPPRPAPAPASAARSRISLRRTAWPRLRRSGPCPAAFSRSRRSAAPLRRRPRRSRYSRRPFERGGLRAHGSPAKRPRSECAPAACG